MGRQMVCLLAALGILGLFSPVQAGEIREVQAPELRALMDSGKVLVVFPLSRIEFNNLHIPGSVYIPLTNLAKGLPADKTGAIAFYCLGST